MRSSHSPDRPRFPRVAHTCVLKAQGMLFFADPMIEFTAFQYFCR